VMMMAMMMAVVPDTRKCRTGNHQKEQHCCEFLHAKNVTRMAVGEERGHA